MINTMPDPTNPSKFRVSGPPSLISTDPPERPIYEMSVVNSRRVDELASSQYAIPSIVLMENAAIALSNHAIEMLKDARSLDILIATGPGNNAGDGFALARHLHNLGYAPTVVMISEPDRIKGDAKINLEIITKMELSKIDAQEYLAHEHPIPGLIVDALFGTGLTRAIDAVPAQLIEHLNACRKSGSLTLSVDVPSGLNAQSGSPIGDSVIVADRTVTFGALKDGYRSIDAQPYLGDLVVAPIGVPIALLESLGTQVLPPQGP